MFVFGSSNTKSSIDQSLLMLAKPSFPVSSSFILIYQFNVIRQDYIIEWPSYLRKNKANFILVHHETTLYG
ncbi:hypothetical protein Bca4012_071996 [Brassica carinata]